MTSSCGRRSSCSTNAWRCSSTPWKTTTMGCCSFISPAAICSRICSGGTRTNRTPRAPRPEAQKYFGHIKRLYRKLDAIIGDIYDRYGDKATIFVMSDHGFANFGRQFNFNSWLRDYGYLNPRECTLDPAQRRLVTDPRLWPGNQRTVPEPQGPRTRRHCRAGRRAGKADATADRQAAGRARLRRQTSHSQGVSRRRGLYGQRDRVGAGSDRRLRTRLPGVLGHVLGRTDAGCAVGQRYGLERAITAPMRWRCRESCAATGQFAHPILRWSTWHRPSWPNSGCQPQPP